MNDVAETEMPLLRRARARAGALKRRADAFRRGLQARDIDLGDMEKILDDLDVRNEHMLVVYSGWQTLRLQAKPNELIELLLSRLAKDGCLAFPTAPFDGTLLDYLRKKPTFDLKYSPSCRGLLTEVARRRKDSFRTPQPACPFSIIGAGARELAVAQRDYSSAYSEDSFLAECQRRNALAITLGLPWSQNSAMHYVEKRMNDQLGAFSTDLLPYRIKDGDKIIEAESEYLRPCYRDRRHVYRALRKKTSFKEFRRYGVDYTRARENDTFEAYASAIQHGKFRLLAPRS